MLLKPLLKRGALALCLLPSWHAVIAAPAVTELQVKDLAAFVSRHEYVVVQATSPDRGCGYCKGADKVFDRASALRGKKPVVFARVQWTPWHDIPDFGATMSVYAVPEQFMFKNGKMIGATGGRPRNPQVLMKRVGAIIENPASSRPGFRAPNSGAGRASARAASKPMTADEQALARLHIRESYLSSVSSACGKRFPDHAESYRQSFLAWRDLHEPALKEAGRLMFERTSREDAAEMKTLTAKEKKILQDWQVRQLGVPLNKAPLAADCNKIVTSLHSLP